MPQIPIIGGIAPAGSTIAEIAGDGSTITVSGNNINFSSAATRASHHPIAGTGNVTSITLADYRLVRGTLTSVITFTHANGTLECPGDANIVGAVGDVVTFFKDAGGAVRIVEYMRADGTPLVTGTLTNGSVTLAKMANLAADTMIGRATASTGVPEAITVTQQGRDLLDDTTVAAQRTTLGLGTIATQAASAVAITGGTVTGITDIAIADGGTGQSSKTAAFDALAPTTTAGDIIYYNGTDNVRLAKGLSFQGLRTNSAATAPEWVGPVVYLATAAEGGSDSNSGMTPLLPVLTAARAMTLAGDYGHIVLMPGEYNDSANRITFNLASTPFLKISAWGAEPVRVYLGQKLTTFTEDSTSDVWKAVISEAIPNDVVVAPFNRQWLFEEGTPEGDITRANALPQQKQRSSDAGPGDTGTIAYRLPHKRMARSASLSALRTNDGDSELGHYWYQLDSGVPTIYFRRSDGEDPNTEGSGIWRPSQTEAHSLVYGGTGAHRAEISGIEVFYGYYGFDLRELGGFSVENCVAYGCSVGFDCRKANYGQLWFCEAAASGQDGIDSGAWPVNLDDILSSKLIAYGLWCHDSADQGYSNHGGCEAIVVGGLYEHNGNAGILGFGQLHVIDCYTRNNLTCGYSILAQSEVGSIQNLMICSNCVTDNDVVGYYPSAVGLSATGSEPVSKIIVRGGEVRNNTYAFFAQANTLIQHSGVTLVNNTTAWDVADGTANVTTVDATYTASAAINFASMLTGAEDTKTITVSGARTTNSPSVELGWSASLEAGISVEQAWVSGDNTVSVRVRNNTAGTIDPASLTVRATVRQR